MSEDFPTTSAPFVPSPSANVDFAIAKTKTTKRAPRALLEHFHAEEGLEGNDDDDDDDDVDDDDDDMEIDVDDEEDEDDLDEDSEYEDDEDF